MPKAERAKPVYVQIQDHLRSQILDGALPEGARLPSIADIAEEWEVARATAAKAIEGLQAERLVHSTTQGTVVLGTAAQSAHDQIDAIYRGVEPGAGQRNEVTAGALVPCPEYVAKLLGIDHAPGLEVARREWISYDGQNPVRLSVSWHPAALAELVPQLTTTEDGNAVAWIEAATGRRPRKGRDFIEAREADEREARALGVEAGQAVLAGAHIWHDEEGVVEYGEWVLPRKRVVSFPYTIG